MSQNMQDIFDVVVTSATHDDVKAGNVATHFSKVRVMADDDRDAMLIAAQMVGCHRMPTSAVVVNVVV